MSNVPFYVPKLKEKGAWLDYRGTFKGGYGWRHNINLAGIKYPVAHHSVTTPTRNAMRDVQTLFNIHVGGNGWGGIGYNFVITSEEVNGFAKVAYVGDLGSARAHTPNTKGVLGIPAGYGNNHLIGICFIGSFHTGKLPTVAQLRSAHYLFNELIAKENARLPGIADSWGSIRGHKEFDWTACPSNQLDTLKTKIRTTLEAKPGTAPVKPYTITTIPEKQVETIRDARIWDLSFTAYADAKALGTIAKGKLINVTQIADHKLGSRYYLHNGGGINAADVKTVAPKPAPAPAPEITEPEPVPVPTPPADHQNDGMIGINDSLARIEAIVTQILQIIKGIFK